MTWRPFVIIGFMLIAFVSNALLLWKEELPHPTKGPQAVQVINPLYKIQYTSGNRRQNLKVMGLPDEMAGAAASAIGRYQGSEKALRKLMQDNPSLVGDVLCGGSGNLPPPYAAMQLLVTEENGIRSLVSIKELYKFEKQPWFAVAPVEGVFNQMEPQNERPEDATLMGVSALLLGLDNDAISGNRPFGSAVFSFGSRFGALKRDGKTAKIEVMAIEYFSLMHFLAELANDDKGGICF